MTRVDDVARWPAAERAVLFQEAAARPGTPGAVAVEKDFWVCWALRRVFGTSGEALPDEASPGGPLVPGMVFKGGTSLSKVYGAIARFSEDLDLSIPREALGFAGAADLTPGLSRTQAGRRLDDMRAACEAAVAGPLAAALRVRVSDALGGERGDAPEDVWDLAVAPDEPGSLLFRYPAALSAAAYGAAAYIRSTVRLEFGARNEVWPAEAHRVRSYALQAFPTLSADPWAAVQVLAAERTFWEKATILHAEYYRPATSRRGERLSRHYADLAALAQGDVGPRALARLDLLAAVAAHKARYFPAAWARYDEAQPGTLRLVPHPALARALRRDYADMREMYFEAALTFDAILDVLGALEVTVNGVGADTRGTR